MVPGARIADKYELVDKVGEGGMATVWRAVVRGAAGFVRPVAVKQIRPEYRGLQHYIDMFVEEARVGSDLAHPNIVQVVDFCADDDCYYLVMEWVEGLDLASFVRAFSWMRQPVPWPLVAAIGLDACQGLAAAHERVGPKGPSPVIHRDISPHNILVGVGGVAKLSDFGLARARDRIISLTAPGTVKGKLGYLSPELTFGKPASPASDVFAMGSVLWEALAGRRLFDGVDEIEVFTQIRRGEIEPIERARDDLPARVADAVHRALAYRPEDRYPSARAMAVELGDCLRSTDEYVDAQGLIAASVERARETLIANEGLSALAPEDLDQPTWTFDVDASGGAMGSRTMRAVRDDRDRS